MKTLAFEEEYIYLKRKYNRLMLTTEDTAHEIGIEKPTLEFRVSCGKNLPPYLKLKDSPSSKNHYNIFDVAYFLNTDSKGTLPIADREKYIKDYIITKYSRLTLCRKELAYELNISVNSLGWHIKNNISLKYKRNGVSKSAPVTFTAIDISKFLSVVVETI